MFPSPYGVSFILIIQNWNDDFFYMEFPSPYGVSFILIIKGVVNYDKI